MYQDGLIMHDFFVANVAVNMSDFRLDDRR